MRGSRHGITRDEYLRDANVYARRGQDLPQSKLCPDRVRWIRANPEGLTAADMAARLGVHPRTVESVRSFRTWAHII